MTVGELIYQLARFPLEAKVLVDSSSDYQSYSEVKKLVAGHMTNGMCGINFDEFPESYNVGNSVLLKY